MKKNSIIRLVALLMLAAMMLSAVSCANTGTPEETTAAAGDNGAQTQAPVDETTADPTRDNNGYLKDDLPEDLKFNDEITLLVWDDVEHEEFYIAYEDLSGDIVEQSLYDRNSKVEERLGLTLNFIRVNGDSGESKNFVAYVNNSVSINAREFDIVAAYSLTEAMCAVNGYLYNMLDDECEYLNFDKPWWSELLLEQGTFGDNLYFASGDISRNLLEMMYVCYANTALLAEYNLQNPQELVEPGEWTYDKFIEMCQGVYKDDGDGVKNCEKDTGDTFGYITAGIHVDPWFYGSGATICERDTDGNIIESPSFSGERVASTLDKLFGLLYNSEYGIHTGDSVRHQGAFGQGRSLFMMDRARVSHRTLAADYGDTEFVIVPCPKYDKDQEKYITVVGNPFTLYGIAADCDNPKMASAFIECFASEGYRIVTPAVFEISLKTRYVADSLSGMMYDIIKSNITYDVGRIFSGSLIGQSTFRNAVAGQQNWGSIVKQNTKALTKALKTLNSKLNK